MLLTAANIVSGLFINMRYMHNKFLVQEALLLLMDCVTRCVGQNLANCCITVLEQFV